MNGPAGSVVELLGQIVQDHRTLTLVGLAVVGVVWVISTSIASVIRTALMERSRREIAAYIAEGSMTAKEGERLMKAQPEDLES